MPTQRTKANRSAEGPNIKDPELIRALPKTDLHVHLDGSLRLETLIDLAKQARVRLPSDTPGGLRETVFKDRYRNLPDYLKGFRYTVAVLQSEEALEQAAHELAVDNQEEGVRYLEVRYAPQLHAGPHLDIRNVILAVDRGLAKATKAFNSRDAVRKGDEPPFGYGTILCALRFFTEDFSPTYASFFRAHTHAPQPKVFALASLELARVATHLTREEGIPIVGFDLAGREKGYPAADHREAYQLAHEHFLGKTVHAGEDYGPESIFQAITECHADRIGHGTFLFDASKIRDRSIVDREKYIESLTRYIGDRRITLEVCLTSNLQTIPEMEYDLKNHPFKLMRKARLSTTLCTDNRLVSHTTVTDEVLKAVRAFQLTPRELKDLMLYGFKRSFFAGSYKEKRAYVRQIIDYYDRIAGRFMRSQRREAQVKGSSKKRPVRKKTR